MNRRDREITDIKDIKNVLERVKFCTLGVNDGDMPYVLPISYGYELSDDGSILTLYFHCAQKGKKSDLWSKSGKASFSIASMDGLIEGEMACDYSCRYASVIGSGTVEQVSAVEEKVHALEKIMENQTERSWTIENKAANGVAVWRLVSSDFTGKQRK